ncbi:hypothetical protein ID866_7064 [Astraeus odoratus]|nr:hypothetical protein ID866_7064 [Astraeus odoratus]
MDWERLVNIAEGNPDEQKIGAFGVGFFSVFSVTDSPVIVSGGMRKRLFYDDDQLLVESRPCDVNKWTIFEMDLKPDVLTSIPKPFDLSRFISTALTFLANVTEVVVRFDGSVLSTIRRTRKDPVGMKLPEDLKAAGPSKAMSIKSVKTIRPKHGTDDRYRNSSIQSVHTHYGAGIDRLSVRLHFAMKWNEELLYIGGFMARLMYERAMSHVRDVWPSGADQAQKEGLFIMKSFTFRPSTPDPKVADLLRHAFFECSISPSFPIVSNLGIRDSKDVRQPHPEFALFMKQRPVLDPSLVPLDKTMIADLPRRYKVTTYTFRDVRDELAQRTLSEEEMVACIAWWVRLFKEGVTEAGERWKKEFIPVAKFKPLRGTRRAGLSDIYDPLPPDTIPISFTSRLEPDAVRTSLGWQEMSIVDWIRHITGPGLAREHDIRLSLRFSNRVINVLNTLWPSLDPAEREAVVEMMRGVECIPTSQGQKKPTEAFFPEADLFGDLAVIQVVEFDNVLQELGVRRNVPWMQIKERAIHIDWLLILIEFTARCLHPYVELGLPIIHWRDGSGSRYPMDALFPLLTLGLRNYPPLDVIIAKASSPETPVRKAALDFLITNVEKLYPDYNPADFLHVAFIPCGKVIHAQLGTPEEVFTSPEWELLGFKRLHNTVHSKAAARLRIKERPPTSAIAQALRKNPPQTRKQAQGYFELLSRKGGAAQTDNHLDLKPDCVDIAEALLRDAHGYLQKARHSSKDMGAKTLSVNVVHIVEKGDVSKKDGESLRRHVLKRVEIFLYDQDSARRSGVDPAKWHNEPEKFTVKYCKQLHITKCLNLRHAVEGVTKIPSVREKALAGVEATKDGKYILWVTDDPTEVKQDWYDMSVALCRLLFKIHKVHDTSSLMTILDADLDDLRRRGYDVDFIKNNAHPPPVTTGISPESSSIPKGLLKSQQSIPKSPSPLRGWFKTFRWPTKTSRVAGGFMPAEMEDLVGEAINMCTSDDGSSDRTIHQNTENLRREKKKRDVKYCSGLHQTDLKSCGIRTKDGMAVFKTPQSGEVPLAELEQFSLVLSNLGEVFDLESKKLHIFWHSADVELMGFNRSCAIYLNLAHFERKHYYLLRGSDDDKAAVFTAWYFIIAHEIAHNKAFFHDEDHELLFTSIAQSRLKRFRQQLAKVAPNC